MEYKWCAIDAEGDVGNKGLLGVAFYSDQIQEYVTDHDEIKRLLLHHAQEGYTFLAHNAQYDLPVIFWQLRIPMKAVYYNGRFNRGEWRYSSRHTMCQMWDTLALSGGLSLSRLGEALGLHKYDTPQILRGIDPNRFAWTCQTHNRGECTTCYAIRDAEIVYRFMLDLGNVLNAWGVKPNRRISGLAMAVWKVLDQPNPIALKDHKVKRLGRKAFHGGRTETFKLGRMTGLYTADVCSMYPSVMRDIPFPDYSSMTYLDNPAHVSVPIDCEGVAECDISIPMMYVPPLPYVYKGTLHYPIGRLRGFWTLAEIRYAIGLGCRVNAWYQVAFSRTNLYPFQRFVDTLWTLRNEYEQTKDPRSLFAKLLMNNLYGRLGMADRLERKDIEPALPNVSIHDQPHNEWYTNDGRLYLTWEREQPSNNQWSNVVWASQITAYARLRLHRYLLMQGQHLVYCDTDSVFSTQPIIGLGEGLGSLRDETYYMEAIISAPKLYAVRSTDGEWRAKAKGVPQAVAMKFLRDGIAEYQQPIKPTSQAIRKIHAGTWVDVKKETQRSPARRPPTDPQILETGLGYSDTVPTVVGPLP